MKKATLEKAYLTIMSVSLICCLLLVGSVLTDRPLFVSAEQHRPVLRTQTIQTAGEEHFSVEFSLPEEEAETFSDTHTGWLLTEEQLEQTLLSCLPERFPAEKLEIDLEEPFLCLHFSTTRNALKDYLEDCGMKLSLKQKLALCLLPQQPEAELSLSILGCDGGLRLKPVSLLLGEKEVPLEGLPENVFSAVQSGINAILKAAGVTFDTCTFTEEGLLFQ